MANKRLPKVTDEDDVEGHRARMPKATGDEADDTEGHRARMPKATGDEDDSTEGHSMLSNPTISRELAAAREQEIQRNLRNRSALVGQGERPHKRKG
jgi:hypothetical protein